MQTLETRNRHLKTLAGIIFELPAKQGLNLFFRIMTLNLEIWISSACRAPPSNIRQIQPLSARPAHSHGGLESSFRYCGLGGKERQSCCMQYRCSCELGRRACAHQSQKEQPRYCSGHYWDCSSKRSCSSCLELRWVHSCWACSGISRCWVDVHVRWGSISWCVLISRKLHAPIDLQILTVPACTGSWYALAQSVAMGGTAVGFAIPASAVAVSYLGGKAIYSRCKSETPQKAEDGRAKL